MYLHIGNQKNVRKKQLIGIFDTDNATVSEITRRFLKKNETEGRVSSAITEIPKSFVLYNGLSADSYARAGNRKKRKRGKAAGEILPKEPVVKKRKGMAEEDALTCYVCFSQLSSTSLAGRMENKE